MKYKICCICLIVLSQLVAADDKGSKDHAIITRYPGQEIKWYSVENFRAYQVPVGPVSGYRNIDDRIDTQGRVTRIFYAYKGNDKTHKEIWINYVDALKQANFNVLAKGAPTGRVDKNKVGGRSWLSYALSLNPWHNGDSDVGTLTHGTSTQGDSAAIIAKKERATGTVYVVVYIEQDSESLIGTLVDIIEVGDAKSGLISVSAEAIGEDINEYGRVVLDGILFEFDKAVLKPESKQTLVSIVEFFTANPDKEFHVVGHTDSKGTFAYNDKLSKDRAQAVVTELVNNYGVRSSRMQAHGVGPLAPIFSNDTDNSREKNRRVELVEK